MLCIQTLLACPGIYKKVSFPLSAEMLLLTRKWQISGACKLLGSISQVLVERITRDRPGNGFHRQLLISLNHLTCIFSGRHTAILGHDLGLSRSSRRMQPKLGVREASFVAILFTLFGQLWLEIHS